MKSTQPPGPNVRFAPKAIELLRRPKNDAMGQEATFANTVFRFV